MAPSQRLRRRDSDSSSPNVKIGSASLPVIALIGICVSILALVILLAWAVLRLHRKRERQKREEERDSAFLTVKGVFKESKMKQTGFSRANLTASVVLPDKAIIRPDVTPAEVRDYYAEQGTLPRPFAPFALALSSGRPLSTISSKAESFVDKRVSTQSFSASAARMPKATGTLSVSPNRSFFSADSSDARDSIRDSFFGSKPGSHIGSTAPRIGPGAFLPARPPSAFSFSAGSRFSVVSSFSGFSMGGSAGGTPGMQTRAVRQAFTPVLPDEPTLAVGERVIVMRSFDDGWCIVARPLASSTLTASGPGAQTGDAELGAVPAWCFVKPLKGLRSERPVRSTSLGVTVQLDAAGAPRDDIISWSNF